MSSIIGLHMCGVDILTSDVLNAGGLAGEMRSAAVEHCSVSGKMETPLSWGIGGVVGSAVSSSSFNSCSSSVDITASGDLSVFKNTAIGGFCGKADNSTTFDDCYAIGDITVIDTQEMY